MDGGKIATETFPVEARDHSEVRCLRQIQRITDRYDRSRQFKFLGFTNWQGRRRLIHFQNCCPTGTLYTAYTVGGEAGNFTVEFGGKQYPARQLVADVRSGTAMLKVEETTPALPIGKSEQLEVATPVVAIGFPLDLQETPNFGK